MFHRRAEKIDVDREKCSGCRMCIRMCFQDVLRFDEEQGSPVVKYLDECEACMVCEANCPKGAIDVTPVIPIFTADPFR
ncbi:MAG: ferredoxin family protein [Clostridiales bacterium]|nr:ferredoxin family protein [Clostridiales bacterium]